MDKRRKPLIKLGGEGEKNDTATPDIVIFKELFFFLKKKVLTDGHDSSLYSILEMRRVSKTF